MKNLLLLFIMWFSMAHLYSQINLCPVLPSPVVYQKGEGSIALPKDIGIKFKSNQLENPVSKSELEQLSLLLKSSHDLSIKEVEQHPFIRLQKLQNVPKDFYSININN